jgi:hypothetical protein
VNGEVGIHFHLVPKLVVEERSIEQGLSQCLKRMGELALVGLRMKKIATPKIALVRY